MVVVGGHSFLPRLKVATMLISCLSSVRSRGGRERRRKQAVAWRILTGVGPSKSCECSSLREEISTGNKQDQGELVSLSKSS